MRKLVLPSASDSKHSVDLFDADMQNEFGGILCVATAILPSQADEYWKSYVRKCGVAM